MGDPDSLIIGNWQQRTKSRLSRVRVTPRKTLFTPSHAPVDLALLAPGRMSQDSPPTAYIYMFVSLFFFSLILPFFFLSLSLSLSLSR